MSSIVSTVQVSPQLTEHMDSFLRVTRQAKEQCFDKDSKIQLETLLGEMSELVAEAKSGQAVFVKNQLEQSSSEVISLVQSKFRTLLTKMRQDMLVAFVGAGIRPARQWKPKGKSTVVPDVSLKKAVGRIASEHNATIEMKEGWAHRPQDVICTFPPNQLDLVSRAAETRLKERQLHVDSFAKQTRRRVAKLKQDEAARVEARQRLLREREEDMLELAQEQSEKRLAVEKAELERLYAKRFGKHTSQSRSNSGDLPPAVEELIDAVSEMSRQARESLLIHSVDGGLSVESGVVGSSSQSSDWQTIEEDIVIPGVTSDQVGPWEDAVPPKKATHNARAKSAANAKKIAQLSREEVKEAYLRRRKEEIKLERENLHKLLQLRKKYEAQARKAAKVRQREQQRKREQAAQAEQFERMGQSSEASRLRSMREADTRRKEAIAAAQRRTREQQRSIQAIIQQIQKKVEAVGGSVPAVCNCGSGLIAQEHSNNCIFHHDPAEYRRTLESLLSSMQ